MISHKFRPGDLYGFESEIGAFMVYSSKDDLKMIGSLHCGDAFIVLSDYPLMDAYGNDCIQVLCHLGATWLCCNDVSHRHDLYPIDLCGER